MGSVASCLAYCSTMPSEPSSRLSAYGLGLLASLDATRASLSASLSAEDEARQAAFISSKPLQAAVVEASDALKSGDMAGCRSGLATALALAETLGPVPAPPARQPVLAGLLEDLVSLQCSVHWLSTGRLLSLAGCRPAGAVQDAEYLGGAISFAGDLSDYAVGRCLEGDVASVEAARDVVRRQRARGRNIEIWGELQLLPSTCLWARVAFHAATMLTRNRAAKVQSQSPPPRHAPPASHTTLHTTPPGIGCTYGRCTRSTASS